MHICRKSLKGTSRNFSAKLQQKRCSKSPQQNFCSCSDVFMSSRNSRLESADRRFAWVILSIQRCFTILSLKWHERICEMSNQNFLWGFLRRSLKHKLTSRIIKDRVPRLTLQLREPPLRRRHHQRSL